MNKVVAVTGANGFVASYLVQKLLAKGYKVVGTVRNPSDESKVGHLKNLPNADQNLKLVQATFDEQQNNYVNAFEGVECVFHPAQPVKLMGDEEELLNVPLRGIEKVLQAVEANKNTIKNFVYTSTMATAMGAALNEPISVKNWTDEESFRQMQFWYPLAKTICEKKVHECCLSNSIHYASILPTTIQGHVVAKQNPNFTLKECVIDIIKGDDYSVGSMMFHSVVYLEDVIDMHINAYEKDVKEGRFIAFGEQYNVIKYGETLKRVCQEEGIEEKVIIRETLPEDTLPEAEWNERQPSLELLGREFSGLEQALRVCVRSIKGSYV